MRDTQNETNKPNRTRRAIYIFGFSIIFALAAFYVTLEVNTPIGEVFVRGAIGLIELIAISYLVTTTVDRSEILSKLGSSMRSDTSEPERRISSSSRQRNRQMARNTRYDEDMSDKDGAMG